MDETMKITIAYAELVLGFPLLVARIVWLVPSAVLTKILSKIADRMDQIVDASIEGFISIISACLVFNHLQVNVPLGVPIILIIVKSLWDWSKDEFYRAWSSTAGIVIGFYLHPILFEYLVNEVEFFRMIIQ